MRPLRLLLVEDSENDATLLIEYLRQGGYEPQCARVDSERALSEALDREWDLIIADYTMPRFSGTAALEMVRGRGLECRSSSCRARSGREVASRR
jgi:DNA-binding response OmpR family regulator